MTTDYRDTVFLPKTCFPMRGNLPKREPLILERWVKMDLYQRCREAAKGQEKYVLHDGPPYANGHLHIGHALNKILKDTIVRSQQMMGKDALYVPGWDCHGLPIEWEIEKLYRKAGRDKDAVPRLEFRQECRDFAQKWIDIQREEFKRLGVVGDWDEPYLTMDFRAEADIAREIHKFAMNGGLYQGSKPVMWSVAEKTALADAEVEYYDHTSNTIHVGFPIVTPSRPDLADAKVVIWTTTPWTIPGNRAVAYGADLDYVLFAVTEVTDKSQAVPGQKLVVAEALLADFCAKAGLENPEILARFKGEALAGTICHHPLQAKGFAVPVPCLAGDFVTTESGTGLVHIAPGHGADDYELGRQHGLDMPFTVAADGQYTAMVPYFAGKRVLKPNGKEGDANAAVIDALAEEGNLYARGKLVHSYPHSWRSKAPLIFRNTPQWFISMERNDLRDKALKAIEDTAFYPPTGRNRLSAMIEARPDWCISRQRAWGVPIPLFTHKKTGEMLKDQAVFDRIVAAFEQEGGDAWYSKDPLLFLGNDYEASEWEAVQDIVEVWFDSGSTHAFVLERRESHKWPADLYLEGSDQHRGWFHTSLLESCGTRGRAPYDAVLTHGFVLDEKGEKMSKSKGNVVSPQNVSNEMGSDILRLWVAASDSSDDLRIGKEILKQVADAYRRLRNTFRFLLGNLDGFSEAERLPMADMPELERWVLHRLWSLDHLVRKACTDYDFHSIYRHLHDFCAVELSAFYLDIRKDTLYCDAPSALERRAARTVLDALFSCLVRWLAPILCYTTEEAWLARQAASEDKDFLAARPEESVHLTHFPTLPAEWQNEALGQKWAQIREIRRVVTGALEKERAAKTIGASLQAHPIVHVRPEQKALLEMMPFADICITSDITVTDIAAPEEAYRLEDVPDVAVVFGLAEGAKCQRCWKVLPEVQGEDGICQRCADVLAG